MQKSLRLLLILFGALKPVKAGWDPLLLPERYHVFLSS